MMGWTSRKRSQEEVGLILVRHSLTVVHSLSLFEGPGGKRASVTIIG